MTISEMKYALHQTANCLFPTVVSLFFHSFSLLDWVNEPDNPIVKSKKIKKLEAAIRYIAASDSFAFISELELKPATEDVEGSRCNDATPPTGRKESLCQIPSIQRLERNLTALFAESNAERSDMLPTFVAQSLVVALFFDLIHCRFAHAFHPCQRR